MYHIKVLSNEDFEQAARSDGRYANVDDTNLGFSDPATNTAYVRHTAWPELNKYLISHEFEHLMEEEGTHEDEHGIRHKKFFKNFLAPAATLGFSKLLDKGPMKTTLPGALKQLPNMVGGGAQSPQMSASPLGQFALPNLTGSATDRLPDSVAGSVSGALNKGLAGLTVGAGGLEIPDYLKERVKGFYSGRMV